MKCRFVTLMLPFLLLLTPGCAPVVRTPDVSLARATLVGMDTSGADIECTLAVHNPNFFDLTLLGYTYDLRMMTLPLAAGGLQRPLSIPAGKDVAVHLPIRVRFGDLLEIAKRLPDQDTIPYQLHASLHLETPLGAILLPVAKTDSLAIPAHYRPGLYLNQFRNMLKPPR